LIKKLSDLFSEEERRSYRFGMTWGWVINPLTADICLHLFGCKQTEPTIITDAVYTGYSIQMCIQFLT